MGHLHDFRVHYGVDEGSLLGQQFRSHIIFEGNVLLVAVEQSVRSSIGGEKESARRIASN